MPDSAIVVGGGPAGALLGYLLASRDIPVTLIERHSDFSREFRGEGLAPGGQLMFREADLWDEFAALPHTVFERAELYFKGRRYAAFDLNWMGDLQARWVSQPAMLEMLIAKASAFPHFTFRRGERVSGPVLHDGRVVGVELAGSPDTEHLEASFVFACDGRYSTLRKSLNLDQPRKPEAFDVVWCKLPMPEFYDPQLPTVRGYNGNGHLGIFIPSYDNLLQVGWVIKKGQYRDFRDRGIESWMMTMADQVSPDMAQHLRQFAGAAVEPFLLDVVCDCYQQWSVPGLTLLGDAAHPMSPVGAQGINIALRDAVVAANHFVPLLSEAADAAWLDRASETFREERMKEVKPVQKMQRRAPLFVLATGRWMDIVMAGVRALNATGLPQRLINMVDIRRNKFVFGVTDVKLTV